MQLTKVKARTGALLKTAVRIVHFRVTHLRVTHLRVTHLRGNRISKNYYIVICVKNRIEMY